jgi:ubiquinone/menaquinone biosynthesis C-methylase UbiE
MCLLSHFFQVVFIRGIILRLHFLEVNTNMDAMKYLTEYYNSRNEDGRFTTRHGSVEFLTTMRYIVKYIKPGDRIIEIGAGTGRYSHALARQGYSVDAVELIEHNIEVFKTNTMSDEKVTVTQGNATDLSVFSDNTYSITLVLGPIYHLFTEEDKLKALSEAVRITKKGGIVFVAYCMMDVSILDYGFMQGHVFELIEKKMLDTETFKAYSNPWDLFELHRKDDIDCLMNRFDVTRLHFVATDGYSCHSNMREALANMDDKTFDLYLKYHYATCEQADKVGLSHHTLDVFRKD